MIDPTTTSIFSPLGGVISGRSKLPPRILLYGIEKIGKSTLGASAPKPIFLQTEDGLGQIDCDRFPLATNYEQVTNYLEALITQPHSYETLVVDSGDWLERIIHDRVCNDSNVKSIELAAGGYGKGYTAALTYWREVLDMLDACRDKGMIVMIICHAVVEKFDDPDSASYDRYSPKLHKKTSGPLITEWADAVLFATRKIRVAVEKEGAKKRATATPIGKSGGDRYLRCVGSPSCVAGNRFNMPDEIPLSWSDLEAAMSN